MHCNTMFISMPGASEWLLIFLCIILPLYFLPTIIANSRKSSHTAGIFVLNLLLGWTLIGWVGAMIWAFSSGPKTPPTVVVHNNSQSYSQEYNAPNRQQPALHEGYGAKQLTQQDKIDQLRQLKQLLDEGVLTPEEFNAQKVILLQTT